MVAFRRSALIRPPALSGAEVSANTLARGGGGPPGFVLVVTVALMVLLAIIAVGMLSLSTISLRSTESGELRALARSNARLALGLAIGQLQRQAGPDTRVTANAGLLDPSGPNPHWLGVWKTRPGEDLPGGDPGVPPVGHHESPLYLTDNRGGEPPAAEAWLVSSPAGAVSPMSSDDSFVTLLDTGREETSVRVPVVPLEDGSCAWWTSDENQKALVNLADPHDDDPATRSYSLAAAQDFDFESYATAESGGRLLAGHASAEDGLIESVVTLATAGLLPIEDPAAFQSELAESHHHLTAHSVGLFTDVKNSGLKRDLSAFFALGDIADDPDTGLAGLREWQPILPGDHHEETGPRFGILKGWADLADRLDADSGPAAIEPQPPNTYFQQADKSAPGHVRDLTDVSKPAIQPVVVEASLGWDFSPYLAGAGAGEFLRAHLYPRLILWNPFNVTLKATRYVVLLRHPSYGTLTCRGERIDTRGQRMFFDDVCGRPESAFCGFVTRPTELGPGETRIFTPDIGVSSGAAIAGKAAAFDPVNYAANVLTADQVPGVENFYFDTTTPLPPETPVNRFAPYGFAANMNSFYSNSVHSDEFIVAQAVDDRGGRLTWRDVTSTRAGFPRIGHFLCQNWGLNRYSKWYGAELSNHPSNNGTPFREFRDGAPDIGPVDNRRPPRLWRRGVRIAWIDDEAEHVACGHHVPMARYTHPWFAAANVRGGLYHHPSWVGIPFAPGWDFSAADGHLYFRQPTDPQLLSSFFPPAPLAAPDDGFPSTCTIYDVPRRNPGIVSLGQLQHAQLSYCTWHPSFVIGHAQPTMNADRDATAIRERVGDPNRWTGDQPWNYDVLIQKGRGRNSHNGEVLVYDLCFEANEALWDRFMLSSIPYAGEETRRRPDWKVGQRLPVARYTHNPYAVRFDREAVARLLEKDPAAPYHRSAAFLVNRGAFNVNSTSVPAWRAMLGTLRGLARESINGGNSLGEHPFSRSVLPGSPGSTSIRSAQDPAAWNGFRSLTDVEIETLAGAIVDQVRERGPFLSLADFVNRRLDEDKDLSGGGALDLAIRVAGLNRGLDRTTRTELRDVGKVETAANRPASIAYGLPGYVAQGDLLTTLAPALTARGDTFRVRAYGEARASDGTVVRAWCEAIVQRTIDYVDPADDPVLPAIESSDDSARVGGLRDANLAFGRRFITTDFRWLPGA